MAEIDNIIKKMFEENPEVTEKDIIDKLLQIKDPQRPDKSLWRRTYIERRLSEYRKNNAPAVGLQIEGHTIPKHPDIFADSSQSGTVETKLNAVENTVSLKDEIDETKSQLSELTDVVIGMKNDFDFLRQLWLENLSTFKQTVSELKKAMAIGKLIPEEEIKYGELVLKEKTINSIKKICDERKIDDESDYIDTLLKLHDEYQDIMENIVKPFNSLVSLTKEKGGSVYLNLSIDEATGKLSYEERKFGRMQGRRRSLAIGLGLGIPIGIVVTLILVFQKIITF